MSCVCGVETDARKLDLRGRSMTGMFEWLGTQRSDLDAVSCQRLDSAILRAVSRSRR